MYDLSVLQGFYVRTFFDVIINRAMIATAASFLFFVVTNAVAVAVRETQARDRCRFCWSDGVAVAAVCCQWPVVG